jgi:RNA polymerase nonessential primary-like sigma factor
MAKQAIRRMVDSLDQRERDIVVLHYGFDGECSRSFNEVGRLMGVSGEWARRLEARALCEARASRDWAELYDAFAAG